MTDQNRPTISFQELSTAIAATLHAVNDGLTREPGCMGISIELINGLDVKQGKLDDFMNSAAPRRLTVNWNDVYHKRVKAQKAWLIRIVKSGQTGALACGQIEVGLGYVSIDYLEKSLSFEHPHGLPTQIAFRFASTLASILGIQEVRLNNPLRELVTYYERTLGLSRHVIESEVKYLSTKIDPS